MHCPTHVDSPDAQAIPPSVPWLLSLALALGVTAAFVALSKALGGGGDISFAAPPRGFVITLALYAGLHSLLHKKVTRNTPIPDAYSRGITGWLLYFLLTCTASLLRFLSGNITDKISEFSGPFGEVFFWGICLVALVQVCFFLYWIYALFALYSKKSNAPCHAKRFLLFFPLYVLVFPVLSPIFSWITTRSFPLSWEFLIGQYNSAYTLHIFQTIAFSTIWYWYLCVSKRVQLTYNTGHPAQPKEAEPSSS